MPYGALLALAAVVFTAVVTEILPTGLLPLMSRGLHASDSQVGQLVSIYAITTAITAIPLTALTRRIPRKALLISLVLGFAAVNGVTALAPSYPVVFMARLVGGMLAGLLWAMAAGFAMRMVPSQNAGRALSIAMIGTPLAFAFGLPIATALGAALGWRPAFGIIAAVGVLLAGCAALLLPSLTTSDDRQRTATFRSVLRMPGLVAVLAATAVFVLGHNIAYTYIAPLVAASGPHSRLDLVLIVFGVMAVPGVLLAGTVADRHMRTSVVVASVVLALSMVALGLFAGSPAVVFAVAAVWGLAYGAAPTLFQTAPARIAGDDADIAQAMVVATWNVAIAIGAFAGGAVLDAWGIEAVPWPAAALAIAAAVIALSVRPAFRSAP